MSPFAPAEVRGQDKRPPAQLHPVLELFLDDFAINVGSGQKVGHFTRTFFRPKLPSPNADGVWGERMFPPASGPWPTKWPTLNPLLTAVSQWIVFGQIIGMHLTASFPGLRGQHPTKPRKKAEKSPSRLAIGRWPSDPCPTRQTAILGSLLSKTGAAIKIQG